MKSPKWDTLKCSDVIRNLYRYHKNEGTQYHDGVAYGIEQTLNIYAIQIRDINASNKSVATAHLRNKRLTADDRIQLLIADAFENIYEGDPNDSLYWTGVYDGINQTLSLLGKR